MHTVYTVLTCTRKQLCLSLIHNDTGTASVTSVMSVTGKSMLNFFNNLIGWMLANAGDATLK